MCIFDAYGKQRTPRVHRLVAEHFIPNPENKPQVNHIDADKENNHVSNLEWVSNAENHAHKMKMGLNVSPVGEASGRTILTEEEAVYIYRSQSSGTSLAKQFNVSTSTISSIKSGRNWKHATEGLKKIG